MQLISYNCWIWSPSVFLFQKKPTTGLQRSKGSEGAGDLWGSPVFDNPRATEKEGRKEGKADVGGYSQD